MSFVFHLVPGFFHGSVSPVIGVSPEPLPRSLLIPTHRRWVTHLLQVQDSQGLVPSPVPSPAARWRFPSGCPRDAAKLEYPTSSSSGCLSQLAASLSTQALQLQPGEPHSFLYSPVPNISPLPILPLKLFSPSSSPPPGSRSSSFLPWTFTTTFKGLGFLAESCPHYVLPLSRPQRDFFEDATPS